MQNRGHNEDPVIRFNLCMGVMIDERNKTKIVTKKLVVIYTQRGIMTTVLSIGFQPNTLHFGAKMMQEWRSGMEKPRIGVGGANGSSDWSK